MNKKLTIQTLYGKIKLEQPLIELIQSATMQRLKRITMGGVYVYATNSQYSDYSRYAHSIGVLALLKHFGASTEEQISGLLHDVSHTAFSHVGDVLFDHKSHTSSYQDEIHEEFLKKQKIDILLKKYNFSLDKILHKSGHHKILEQDLPNICVDRLEYNLIIGKLNTNLISEKDIKLILNDLNFENKNFFFTNIQIAKKLASISLYCTKHYWTNAKNILLYKWLSEALKIAIKIKLITNNEIHFSTDDNIWNKLEKSNDTKILNYLEKIKSNKNYYSIGNPQNYDEILYGKFRGIDPFVKINNKLKRLTKLDCAYQKEYHKVKNIVTKGTYIILDKEECK